MRFSRPASVALATAVLAASAYTAPASAQLAGVGSSLTSTNVLTAQLGEGGQLLDLLLLGDQARSTIDPAVASPEAYSRLTLIKAATSIVPNSPINVSQSLEAKSTGPSEVPIAAGPLASASLPAALAPVLSGTVSPGKLTATVTDGVAASGLNVELAGINAVGGLVSLESLKSTMVASSAGGASDAVRGASVKNLDVLKLGALLQGLGLPLAELTPAKLVALVDALAASTGLPLPSGATTLAGAVTAINAAINDLQATVATTPSSTTQITSAIDTTTNSLLTGVGLQSPVTSTSTVVNDVVALVNDTVDQLQALLSELLAKGLAALDKVSLLRMEGVEVGVSTKAVESLDGSTANVTGKVGKVLVGGIELPGVDLLATTSAISANVAAINKAVGDVLALVDPGLAGVVDIGVLEKATSVTQSDGYTRSRAGLTAASATITPPANLAAIVKTITDQVGVAEALAGSTVGVPVLSTTMNDLSAVLKTSTSVLTSPSRIRVASVLSASDFARAGTTTTGAPVDAPMLPRTGGSDLVLLGGLAGVLALALRRLVRNPGVRTVRIDGK